ncbi:hypothetical protein [Xiamenia xianingshaonis]|uniref:Uncharacterized protein n=1 Tax=Xiamenia xianingshaonis TaxID=2682776 RepID=A0A9E6MRH8_9ACTN|nr:hypothetical protein [Xiamenia xianingshaonis]NHM13231.1 hypothetical protein [Xiamenia xianingshaonis]QTU84680.1 hypothetical protein J7S26_01775 [Xiamenia xianingshaonis]
MLVKPSLVLQVKLVGSDWSEACAAEVKRSYMYIAQSIVSELGEDEAEDGNVMRLSIRLMRSYWDPTDPKSQELWEASMMPWLVNATRNLSTAMHNYNTVRHPMGAGNLIYEWADYDFGANALIRVKVDAENRITGYMPAIANEVRTLLHEGALGEGVAMIRVPSRASWKAQVQAAREAQRQAAEAAAAAEAQAAEQAEPADPQAAEAAGAEDGSPAAVIAEPTEPAEPAAPQADADRADADAPETPEASEDVAGPDASTPAFDIDFSVWGIEYADGTVVEYDSATRTLR